MIFLNWIFALPLLFATAHACEVTNQVLPLVFPRNSALHQPVQVQLTLEQEQLKAHFEVHTPSVHALPVLGHNQYPFQFDVVEIFLSLRNDDSPYFEFELSPFDQTFTVKILGPGKSMINGVNLGLIHSVQKTQGGWTGDMQIPLRALGWSGQAADIRGNAFAILGSGAARSYFSLFLPPTTAHVNFHQTQYFKPLVTCDRPS